MYADIAINNSTDKVNFLAKINGMSEFKGSR